MFTNVLVHTDHRGLHFTHLMESLVYVDVYYLGYLAYYLKKSINTVLEFMAC